MLLERFKSGAVSAAPPVAGSPSTGNPTEADPATVIGAWWFYAATQLIHRTITDGGLALDDDLDLLRDAVRAIADRRIENWVGAAPQALDTLVEIAARINGLDARYAPQIVTASRAADAANINTGVTTTLASLAIPATGRWLAGMHTVAAASFTAGINNVTPFTLSIDGGFFASPRLIEGQLSHVPSAWRVVEKNAGDSVEITGVIQAPHRYAQLESAAVYLGPAV